MVELLILSVWVVFAVLTAAAASAKGYSAAGFFLFGLLAPLIALIVVLCLSNRTAPKSSKMTLDDWKNYTAMKTSGAVVSTRGVEEERFQIYRRGEFFGEFTAAEAREMVASKELAGDDVWLDGEIWRSVDELIQHH